jgi:2-amino-4-hydroxy-6-hydroxymethyldihydropteridine diphosphokinase
MSEQIFLSLGTNLGDRLNNLKAAVAALEPFVVVQLASAVYETEPWGYLDQPRFLNQVIQGTTSLTPELLLSSLKKIEVELGRVASVRYGPRLIDLDILFYGNQVIKEPGLTIPHARLAERAFVLVPLAEIAPSFIHPKLGQTVTQLLSSVDRFGIHLYQED